MKAKAFKACFQQILLTEHTVTNITKRELHLHTKIQGQKILGIFILESREKQVGSKKR
jgi:hypothetical protein